MGRPKGSKNQHRIELFDRFWGKVKVGKLYECWEWQAFVHPSGYGKIQINGKSYHAHRVAWELTSAEKIPSGMCVCHTCDNRRCCNPSHLFLGTYEDNAHDRDEKGRAKIPDNRGSRHGMSKLTEKQVKEIRNLCDTGEFTQGEIAERYGIDRRTVGKIDDRKSWGWLQ